MGVLIPGGVIENDVGLIPHLEDGASAYISHPCIHRNATHIVEVQTEGKNICNILFIMLLLVR